MTSIIDYYKKNNINYTASSLSLNLGKSPYNVFDSSKTFFVSQLNPAGQWWQVTFEFPVSISSYTIGEHIDEIDRLKRWKISYSINNGDLVDIREESHDDIRGNVNFVLNPAINCTTFRITHIENTEGTNQLYFSYFNCYETINKIKKMKVITCDFVGYKYRLISKELTMILVSTIWH